MSRDFLKYKRCREKNGSLRHRYEMRITHPFVYEQRCRKIVDTDLWQSTADASEEAKNEIDTKWIEIRFSFGVQFLKFLFWPLTVSGGFDLQS